MLDPKFHVIGRRSWKSWLRDIWSLLKKVLGRRRHGYSVVPHSCRIEARAEGDDWKNHHYGKKEAACQVLHEEEGRERQTKGLGFKVEAEEEGVHTCHLDVERYP